ncbi:HNH endonuclease [Methylobacterium sp. DB1607]|nr:HNH endonuclease [Methylobacterium sp. DB1607]
MGKPGWQLGHFETTPVCEWCLTPVFRPRLDGIERHDDRTRDHVIPWSRGGKDLSNNVVAACRLCNNLRGHMPADEFRELAREHIAPYRYDLAVLRSHLMAAAMPRWGDVVERARLREEARPTACKAEG